MTPVASDSGPRRRRLLVLVVLCALCVGASARASNYDLLTAGLVPERVVKQLKRLGIETTEQLYQATSTPHKLRKLARKLGVSRRRMREYKELCDLLRVVGIGPKVARVLRLVGVRSVRDLARSDVKVLTRRISEANKKAGVLGKLPDETIVGSWVDRAKAVLRGSRGSRK